VKPAAPHHLFVESMPQRAGRILRHSRPVFGMIGYCIHAGPKMLRGAAGFL
jgi:hypothetical protein